MSQLRSFCCWRYNKIIYSRLVSVVRSHSGDGASFIRYYSSDTTIKPTSVLNRNTEYANQNHHHGKELQDFDYLSGKQQHILSDSSFNKSGVAAEAGVKPGGYESKQEDDFNQFNYSTVKVFANEERFNCVDSKRTENFKNNHSAGVGNTVEDSYNDLGSVDQTNNNTSSSSAFQEHDKKFNINSDINNSSEIGFHCHSEQLSNSPKAKTSEDSRIGLKQKSNLEKDLKSSEDMKAESEHNNVSESNISKNGNTLESLSEENLKFDSRFNVVGIQMLPESLHRQVFGMGNSKSTSENAADSLCNLNKISKFNDVKNKNLKSKTSVKSGSIVGEPEAADLKGLNGKTVTGKVHGDSVKLKRSRILQHLKEHGLAGKKTTTLENIDLDLPKLYGKNIDEHFRHLAETQLSGYLPHAQQLASTPSLPAMPRRWVKRSGWTRYDPVTRRSYAVTHPDEQGLVFDVEVLMTEGAYPTIATAASNKAWYSWCSPRMFTSDGATNNSSNSIRSSDLIPLEPDTERSERRGLVIGHNVGFDRSFIREQYDIKCSKLRFLDTMSLHIAVAGLTSLQRMLYVAKKAGSHRKEVLEHEEESIKRGLFPSFEWTKETSLNNLNDVHQLYCKGAAPLEKHLREVFISGNMQDVHDNFQDLMTYCADDVKATHTVFQKVWPEFLQRFPHPVTLAGMLEMGTAYLPVNNNWFEYISSSQRKFEELQSDMNQLLCGLADDALNKLNKQQLYKKDAWMWDLDWSDKRVTVKQLANEKNENESTSKQDLAEAVEQSSSQDADSGTDKTKTGTKSRTKTGTKAGTKTKVLRSKHLIYPSWYAELCPRDPVIDPVTGTAVLRPTKLSMQRRISSKLLRLTWYGFPLHYSTDLGWGYVVPLVNMSEEEREILRQERESEREKERETGGVSDDERGAAGVEYPIQSLMEIVKETRPDWLVQFSGDTVLINERAVDDLLGRIQSSTGEEGGSERARLWGELQVLQDNIKDKLKSKKKKSSEQELNQSELLGLDEDSVPHYNVIPGCAFYTLPHKDGADKKVGNPLAKDFRSRIEQGVLKSYRGSEAERILKCGVMCSYWKNNLERIGSQMVVDLSSDWSHSSRDAVTMETGFVGAILPRVVTAGTVTRRAVEATWLTASNAYEDRIGSELKSMIQSPPGFHFVGADVDSQELWIAALLGDAHFAGEHGCTAFGWMTLQGNKTDGTDLHSKTAKIVGINRDQAKVFNYGRIYGAGQKFAEQMLHKFNHRLSKEEVKQRASAMFRATKGRKVRIKQQIKEEDDDDVELSTTMWEGGSESHMFNKLESIARSSEPRTPVLSACISKALEPRNVSNEDLEYDVIRYNHSFMTSRINWVVQSSAVDYLHLMLVCMRWLSECYDIEQRFCISIHDEVRYLVRSDDRYRSALALHITNLLTRAMFAHRLGLNDLPLSIAFFSSVDVDTCLRKEVTMDCVTPSNPQGLHKGYGIPPGESLDIHAVKHKTGGRLEKNEKLKDKNFTQTDLNSTA